MKTDIVEGELFIDIDGLSIFTNTKCEVTSIWDGGKLTSATAILTEWKCGDEPRSRRDLVFIVGDECVEQAEDDFAERWAETAEADARDAHADLCRRDSDE